MSTNGALEARRWRLPCPAGYRLRSVAAAGLLLLTTGATAQAQTTRVFSQSQACTIHTDQGEPDEHSSYCTHGDFVVGVWPGGEPFDEARSLIEFDTSVIPANSVVLAATLSAYGRPPQRLTPAQTTAPHPVSVHHVTSQWSSFGTNWLYRQHDGVGAPKVAWATPGGDLEVDRLDTASVPAASQGAPASWNVRASAQRWVAQPSANHGLIMRSVATSGGIELCGNQWLCQDSTRRPTLEVTYRPDITGPVLDQGGELVSSAHGDLTGDAYRHWVDAEDGTDANPGSGVRRIEVFVDGQSQAARGGLLEQDCPQTNCDGEVEWDFRREHFAVGSHTVRVVADDWAGNSSAAEFVVYLSATRTDDPPEADGFTEEETLTAAATIGCGRDIALTSGGMADVASISERSTSSGRQESTIRYDDRSYFVAVCDPAGDLIEAQGVAPRRTPDGVRMLVTEMTTPVPGTADVYRTTHLTYPSAEDPRFIASWRSKRARYLNSVRSPTPRTP
jgi:hypothetical protein